MKRFFVVMLAVIAVTGLVGSAMAADKLLVKDSSTNTKFVVTDSGWVGFGGVTAPAHPVDAMGDAGQSANFQLTKYGGNPGAIFRAAGGNSGAPTQVLANGLLGGFVATGMTSAGSFAMPYRIGIYYKATEAWTATGNGTYFTFETTPAGSTTRTLKATLNDAGLNVVGAVTQTSSREYKDQIQELAADRAVDALKNLTPVTYVYKGSSQPQVGFIAEDVPALVAKDGKSLAAMDIVAVLTKVVQEQNKTIEALSAKVDMLEKAATK